MKNSLSISLAILVFLCSQDCFGQSEILFSRSPGGLNTGGTLNLLAVEPKTRKIRSVLPGTVKGRGEYNITTNTNNSKIIFNTYRFGGWKLGLGEFGNTGIGKVRKLTNRKNYEYNASFSPDGKQIVYQEYNWSSRNTSIFIADGNGYDGKEFENSGETDNNPIWSNDGKSIIFTSFRTSDYNIYSKNVATGKVVQLTDSKAQDFAPSTSKRHGKIAFLSDRNGQVNLYVMNADGSMKTLISPTLNADKVETQGFWSYKTSWSPDGEQVVFNAMKNGNHELFVVKVSDKVTIQLTKNNDSDICPYWLN